jgi:hypothetical protein
VIPPDVFELFQLETGERELATGILVALVIVMAFEGAR